VLGRKPEKSEARVGSHAGAAQWALEKDTPILERRSMLGVLDWGLRPVYPTQWFRSSTGMNKMFIFCFAVRQTHPNASPSGKRYLKASFMVKRDSY
jgi:hypothetical protein